MYIIHNAIFVKLLFMKVNFISLQKQIIICVSCMAMASFISIYYSENCAHLTLNILNKY